MRDCRSLERGPVTENKHRPAAAALIVMPLFLCARQDMQLFCGAHPEPRKRRLTVTAPRFMRRS